jgi:hypothetical protein
VGDVILAKVNVEGSSPFARSKALVIPGLFLGNYILDSLGGLG